MSNIEYLINNIVREVPPEIIVLAFSPPAILGLMRPSVPHLIRDIIIDKWVMADTNKVGGVETVVDLSRCVFNSVDGGMVVEISPRLTAGKEITSVLSVGYGSGIVLQGGATIASAAIGPAKVTDARVQLIGPNTIYIEAGNYINCTHLRCILENNEGFTNISARLLPLLAELCVLATKCHIYNNLVIKLGTGVILQGVDMSKITEIVNAYADSFTMYHETLTTKWKKANIMSDRVSHGRYISLLVPR